jgi:hypothetical protein
MNEQGLIHIDINNVVRWLEAEKVVWDRRKLSPIIAPPFEKGRFIYYLKPGYTIVVDMEASELNPGEDGPPLTIFESEESSFDIPPFRWVLSFTVRAFGITNPLVTYHAFVRADGEWASSKMLAKLEVEEIPNVADFASALNPVLFAISLLHCKNIELSDLPPPSRQIRRLAERKGMEIVRYKTLVIEPFKKQVRHEARQAGESEIHRALHICRGHFREYSEERPLFGKYAGRFWVPMHARGSKEHGEVRKDYKVIADDDATPP